MTDDAEAPTDGEDAVPPTEDAEEASGTGEDSEPETGATAAEPGVGVSPTAAIEEAEPAEEREPGALARAGTALAWVVGVVLIGVGILGLSGGGSGLVPLGLGLVVTPRTRRELRELCQLLCT